LPRLKDTSVGLFLFIYGMTLNAGGVS